MVALLAVIVDGGSAVLSQTHRTESIGGGAEWETPCFVLDSGRPGPAVLIVGGIHGDEPAGARAAGQIRNWQVTKGRLIVLPAANRPGLHKGTRSTPGAPEEEKNLNRNFPNDAGDQPRGDMASAIWRLVEDQQPDWLVDLHEGVDFHQRSKSVGGSIIRYPSEKADLAAELMIEAVNATIDNEDHTFRSLRYPATGSLARAAAKCLGASALILETARKSQPLSLRIRQHRIMVHRLLTDLGMVASEVDDLFAEDDDRRALRVALYDAGGSLGSPGPAAFDRILRASPNVVVHRVGPPEIVNGALEQFGVVVFPGGGASNQAKALGQEGRQAIRRFVRDGGGYYGSCAGAYLASTGYDWSLKIIDAHTVDRQHWKRGSGDMEVELTDEGQRLYAGLGRGLAIRYANGPLLGRSDLDDLSDFTTLGVFRTEVAKNGAPTGMMKDTPALICGELGRGRVLLTSPHPEYVEGLEPMVVRGVRWVGGRE